MLTLDNLRAKWPAWTVREGVNVYVASHTSKILFVGAPSLADLDEAIAAIEAGKEHGADLQGPVVATPADYGYALSVFHDAGHPARAGHTAEEIRNKVRDMEIAMGAGLRSKLVAKGAAPR